MANGTIRGFEDLKVWQAAMRLAEMAYEKQARLPKEERYALGDQIRRSAVSIPSNVAEGFGRGTKADLVHFLFMARGSLYELRTQVMLAVRLGLFEEDESFDELATALGRMINGYAGKVQISTHR